MIVRMQKYPNAKYRKIANELLNELRLGRAPHPVYYYTRLEIASLYHISETTAFCVQKELERCGAITCEKGRRPMLAEPQKMPGFRDCRKLKIAVVMPDNTGILPSIYEEILFYLKNLIANGGNSLEVITIQNFSTEKMRGIDGMILMPGEGVPDAAMQSGLPCVTLAQKQAEYNSVCCYPCKASMETVLHLMKYGIRNILRIGINNRNFHNFTFFNNETFEICNYDYRFQEISGEFYFRDDAEACAAELMRNTSDGPLAILVDDPYLSDLFAGLMRGKTEKENKQVQIIGTTLIQKDMPFPVVNMKIDFLARNLLNLLYTLLEKRSDRQNPIFHTPDLVFPR